MTFLISSSCTVVLLLLLALTIVLIIITLTVPLLAVKSRLPECFAVLVYHFTRCFLQ